MSSSPSDVAAPTALSANPVLSPAPAAAPARRVPLFSGVAWSPLKVELFRSLYIATSIAQIGTWAREAGSPSLMMSLTKGWANQPDMVGRITLYSNLPICLFSLVAGALADVLDRRRVLIWTNVWMIVVSVVLGWMTLQGSVSPWGLLGLTFLLGLGTAASGPALQAVLPELVPPKDMSLAINLNSVALNVARAIGPATFILVTWVVPGQAGIGTSYFLSAVTFAGAVWVLWRWKRAPQRAALHGESVLGAIRSGIIYTLHSRPNRAILIRVVGFIIPALALWSQVPVIAQNQLSLPREPASYALLFAFVGVGAVCGVLLMPGLHARFNIDPVVNVCTLLFALGLIALSFTTHLWLAALILIFLGVNWVIIPTNFNTATQKSVPIWVKGRAISFYLTILFGSFAVGGAMWGKITTATSIHTSLIASGIAMAALLVLARRYPLTLNQGHDLAPAFAKGSAMPSLAVGHPPERGLVRIFVDYKIDASREAAFRQAMRELGHQRRRNGAQRWELIAQSEPGTFRELYEYSSTEEFNRQSGRLTRQDLKLQDEAKAFQTSAELATPTFVEANRIGWRGERILV